MIYEALTLMQQELRAYLESLAPNNVPDIQLGGAIEGAGQQSTERLLIRLVNVAEEATLKNLSPYQRIPGGFELVNPPVYLNLFVLLTANFQQASTALMRLAQVVQCFQRRRELTNRSSGDGTTTELRLCLDLCSPSFEQISQLWGTLGGNQAPFVLYKVRLVEEQAREVLGQGPEIQQIERRYTL